MGTSVPSQGRKTLKTWSTQTWSKNGKPPYDFRSSPTMLRLVVLLFSIDAIRLINQVPRPSVRSFLWREYFLFLSMFVPVILLGQGSTAILIVVLILAFLSHVQKSTSIMYSRVHEMRLCLHFWCVYSSRTKDIPCLITSFFYCATLSSRRLQSR